MAKDVGAKKVIFASCAPPIRYAPLSPSVDARTAAYPFSAAT